MGAYENPQVLLDTQTPKYMQQVQESIAGSFANVAQSYVARQKEIRDKLDKNVEEIKANDKKSEEWAMKWRRTISDAEIKNPTVNWHETFNPMIEKGIKLKASLDNYTAVDRSGTQQEIAQIESSVDSVTGTLADYSSAASTLDEVKAKGAFTMGGYASSNDPAVNKATLVMQEKLPGIKKFWYKDLNPQKLMLSVYEEDGITLIKEYSAQQLKKINQKNGLIRVIPDQTLEFDKLKITNSTIFESAPAKQGDKTIQLPTGKINPNFLIKKDGKPLVEAVDVVKDGGYSMTIFKQKVDLVELGKDPNFDTTIKAQAAGLLEDNEGAIDFYNDIISRPSGRWKGTDQCFEPDGVLSDKDKAMFVEDYKQYFLNTQINPEQTIDKPNENEVTVIRNVKSIIKKEGKKAEKTKPTKSLLPIEQVNEFTNKYDKLVKGETDLIKLPAKAGGKMFRYNSKTGKVYETNAAEEILDNKVDRSTYREYLGVKNTKPGLKTK